MSGNGTRFSARGELKVECCIAANYAAGSRFTKILLRGRKVTAHRKWLKRPTASRRFRAKRSLNNSAGSIRRRSGSGWRSCSGIEGCCQLGEGRIIPGIPDLASVPDARVIFGRVDCDGRTQRHDFDDEPATTAFVRACVVGEGATLRVCRKQALSAEEDHALRRAFGRLATQELARRVGHISIRRSGRDHRFRVMLPPSIRYACIRTSSQMTGGEPTVGKLA